jgi:hypothetical protein
MRLDLQAVRPPPLNQRIVHPGGRVDLPFFTVELSVLPTGALSEKRLPNPLRFHYLPSCFPMKVAASGGQLHFQTNLFDQGRKIGKCAEADTSGLCPNFWFQRLTFTVSLQKKPNFLQFSPLQLQ